jgi:hypothetical protein
MKLGWMNGMTMRMPGHLQENESTGSNQVVAKVESTGLQGIETVSSLLHSRLKDPAIERFLKFGWKIV